jgi:hypothetical protein
VNRRGFCRSAAAATFAAIASPSRAALRPHYETARVAVAVYDERYTDAREFADALSPQFAVALQVGHMGQSSLDELAALFGKREGRIAGMSTDAHLLIVKSLAREMGFLPIFEGRHDARRADRVRHRLRAKSDGRSIAISTRSNGLCPAELAEQLSHLCDDAAKGWVEVEADGPRSVDHPGYLTSWIFAPQRRKALL